MNKSIIVGCMRFASFSEKEMDNLLHNAIDMDLKHFDHADIYGDGQSEEIFGKALANDRNLRREDLFIQTKCGIVKGKNSYYDLSEKHIVESVENSLKRLKTEYIDMLILHRPDALTEPEEVASAFDLLEKTGKVKQFGVSNHKPAQIELLRTCVKQEIKVNQVQFSIPVSNMIANGMEVNMTSEGSYDRDDNVLDYCRKNKITIQAWSPLQMPDWKGCFIGAKEYEQTNQILRELAEEYSVSVSAIAYAWILRHPANMQIVTGTTKAERLKDAVDACNIKLNREQWYRLYLSAGHILP